MSIFSRREELNDNVYALDTPEMKTGLNAFMTKVFGQMFAGMLLTALAAAGFSALLVTSGAAQALASNIFFLIGIFVVEIGLVIAISAGIKKLSPGMARLLFYLYAAVNGVTLSYVLLAYANAPGVISKAFIMTAIFFGTMCVYGMVTKADLTSAGKIFFVGLIAMIIASVVNMFLRSSMLDFIVCIGGIAVFTGLTAYDTQKLKQFYLQNASGGDTAAASKVAIIGALQLYLDFINLFLYLVRIFGRNK